jgi:hypothetical protein
MGGAVRANSSADPSPSGQSDNRQEQVRLGHSQGVLQVPSSVESLPSAPDSCPQLHCHAIIACLLSTPVLLPQPLPPPPCGACSVSYACTLRPTRCRSSPTAPYWH